MCVCVHLYVCVRLYMCVYTYTCVCVCLYTHTHAHTLSTGRQYRCVRSPPSNRALRLCVRWCTVRVAPTVGGAARTNSTPSRVVKCSTTTRSDGTSFNKGDNTRSRNTASLKHTQTWREISNTDMHTQYIVHVQRHTHSLTCTHLSNILTSRLNTNKKAQIHTHSLTLSHKHTPIESTSVSHTHTLTHSLFRSHTLTHTYRIYRHRCL